MKPTLFRTNAHLLLCTGPSCARAGSRALLAALWNGLERERMAYYTRGGTLRLTESGCLGACSFGPNLTCYFRREGVLREAWYAGVDYPGGMGVARALHEGGVLPSEGRYDADGRDRG